MTSKIVLLLACLVLVFGVTTSCGAEDPAPIVVNTGAEGSTPAGITVVGVGEVLGQPDTLTVTIGVRVTRTTVAEANQVAAERATAVIDALESSGVAEDDIQTVGYSIYPEYNYSERGSELIGFTVANNVTAKIRDVDEAGRVIDAAAAAGGDDTIVQGIGFSVEDDTDRLDAARSRAWENAEAKARQLAELAGVTLGPAVKIVEGIESSPVTRLQVDSEAGFDAASTPIQSGQVVSTVTLTVVFGLGGS